MESRRDSTVNDSLKTDTPAKRSIPDTAGKSMTTVDTVVLIEVELIRKSLRGTILKKELDSIPPDQKKFKYEAIDLNGDSTTEYFVSLPGSYFCSAKGCRTYLLNHKGKLINSIYVTDLPLYTAGTRTNGWYDLVAESGSKYYLLQINKGKYPSDPAKEPIYKAIISDSAKLILNVMDREFKTYDL